MLQIKSKFLHIFKLSIKKTFWKYFLLQLKMQIRQDPFEDAYEVYNDDILGR